MTLCVPVPPPLTHEAKELELYLTDLIGGLTIPVNNNSADRNGLFGFYLLNPCVEPDIEGGRMNSDTGRRSCCSPATALKYCHIRGDLGAPSESAGALRCWAVEGRGTILPNLSLNTT